MNHRKRIERALETDQGACDNFIEVTWGLWLKMLALASICFCLIAFGWYLLLAYPLYFLGVCASLLIGYFVHSRIKN